MLNMEFFQELFEPLAIELSAVVNDDGSREAIMAYDRFPDERFHLGYSDVGHGLGFDPFGEVIHGNEEKLSLLGRLWERSQNVYSPPLEGPWRNEGGELRGRKVLGQSISLAGITCLHILDSIFLHVRPIIALLEHFMSKCSSLEVIAV